MSPGYSNTYEADSDRNSYCCSVDRKIQGLLATQQEQAAQLVEQVYDQSLRQVASLSPRLRHDELLHSSLADMKVSASTRSETSGAKDTVDDNESDAPVVSLELAPSTTLAKPSIRTFPYSATHYAYRPVPEEGDSADPNTTSARRVYVPALITISDAEKSNDRHGPLGNPNGAVYDPLRDDSLLGDGRTGESSAVGNNVNDKPSSGSGYIVYVVRVGDEWEVRHRYSEFESLRRALQRLYPTIIIPPIPEKHSLTQYAVLQSRTKDDPKTIARRKRMLQTFLNRLVRHPILASEHILHRFLEPGVAWSEVLHSPSLTNLPKNPLHLSPSAMAHRTTSGASAEEDTDQPTINTGPNPTILLNVPIPSGLQPLRHPDPRWVECEYFTNRFANSFQMNIEKPAKRLEKRWSEIAADYAELGAVYNGFSLTEVDALAGALEKVGQAADSTFMATHRMVGQLEADVTEPLHEYSQYANEIKQVLKHRNLKHLQLEQVTDSLQRKRDQMDDLEIADQEARRLTNALEESEPMASGVGRQSLNTTNQVESPSSSRPTDEHVADVSVTHHDPPQDIAFPPTLDTNGIRRGSEPMTTDDDPWRVVGAEPESNLQDPLSQATQDDTSRPMTQSAPLSPQPGTKSTLQSTSMSKSTTTGSSTTAGRKSSLGSGFIHRLSYKLHGVIDVDPEATRRNTMAKAKEAIQVLEEQQELLTNDLSLINAAIQLDLNQFQRQKVQDVRDILIAMARLHIEWAKKNKEAWQEVKEEVQNVTLA
ncbi:Sorting nexin, cytoplasm-to-vacuole targeting pathway/endosomal sorting [Dispira parvispora]|uniref:Sorting nexin, cytoplasm-to-vacuole targeting pathway/endosomal sorting n=1 Tax=Dispira parvispora TaxID=1520584 RepID=A0A9W8E9R5_9FUNG|nr:Sorting nexin, cytoplasm-to-vacuole targeting pathway/endosomal sorting [Dispira parvispora]